MVFGVFIHVELVDGVDEYRHDCFFHLVDHINVEGGCQTSWGGRDLGRKKESEDEDTDLWVHIIIIMIL